MVGSTNAKSAGGGEDIIFPILSVQQVGTTDTWGYANSYVVLSIGNRSKIICSAIQKSGSAQALTIEGSTDAVSFTTITASMLANTEYSVEAYDYIRLRLAAGYENGAGVSVQNLTIYY